MHSQLEVEFVSEQDSKELTMQTLAELPYRALVGFATRCARRVYPTLESLENSPIKETACARTVAALTAAETFSRGQFSGDEDLAVLAKAAYEYAHDELGDGQYALFAAGHAARSGELAAVALKGEITGNDTVELIASVFGAYRVIMSFVSGPILQDFFTGTMVEEQVRADFDNLLALKPGRAREAGNPIDPSEEGPLGLYWPEGFPSWYS